MGGKKRVKGMKNYESPYFVDNKGLSMIRYTKKYSKTLKTFDITENIERKIV